MSKPYDLTELAHEVVGGNPVALKATSVLYVPYDPTRVSLVLPAVPGVQVSYSCGAPAVSGQGVVIPSGGQSVILSRILHGGLVSYAWYGILATGTADVSSLWSGNHT